MLRFLILFFIAAISLSTFQTDHSIGQEDSKSEKKTEEVKEITLERLFPKESFFGPRARSTEFSADGRYAAYLYRGYDERRHGNDLWLYDFETGENTRVTNLAMMAKFQRSARIVKQDRLSKNKKPKSSDDNKSDKDKDNESKEESEDEVKDDSNEDDNESDSDGDDESGEDDRTKEEIEEENKLVNTVSKKDADDKYAPAYSGISGFKWHPE
jgi:hypothetical protein